MKITKIGHCCLVIEEKGLKILTDPGTYSTGQDETTGIDVILITHEHGDHFHIPSLKKVLENNPKARVITNTAVGKLLDAENIKYEILEDGQNLTVDRVLIEGNGNIHAEIHKDWPSVQNTGYFFQNRFYYPGDALHNPGKPVEILALPVGGPWIKISEAVEYAKDIAPKICFPVHDGGLKNPGVAHRVPAKLLPERNIEFVVIADGETKEF